MYVATEYGHYHLFTCVIPGHEVYKYFYRTFNLFTPISQVCGLPVSVGIATVILPNFGTMGKLKFLFSLSVFTQFDLYQHQSGEHVES